MIPHFWRKLQEILRVLQFPSQNMGWMDSVSLNVKTVYQITLSSCHSVPGTKNKRATHSRFLPGQAL